MGKRKVFLRTDLAVPGVEHARDATGRVVIPPKLLPPSQTIVRFPEEGNASPRRSFDFARWYSVGADEITYACQRQVERYLATHDGDRTPATVASYCSSLRYFLDYCLIRAAAQGRPIELGDIGRVLVDGYLAHLANGKMNPVSQKSVYDSTKAVLVSLGQRKLIRIAFRGDETTFPRNPFPHSHRNIQGEKPLPRRQRDAFVAAVKTAVMPLKAMDAQPTSELLAYALLIVALHTGRNTTPLIEMDIDCLRPHPKDNVRFLVLYKRRGNKTDKVPVRFEKSIESAPAVWTGVARLIEHIKVITAPLRANAPAHLKDRLWLYENPGNHHNGVRALVPATLANATGKLVAKYSLVDVEGTSLRINVSRLRKTFANRIYEILGGDVLTAARATGHTPLISGKHYLRPGEDAERNWKFMGKMMTEELLSGALSATVQKTPSGQCSGNSNGQFAPKRNDAPCMNFLDCIRCRNFIVTGEDLYRLMSFYWLIVRERDRLKRHTWDRHYAHIVRLIDRDVIGRGVKDGVFTQTQVDAAKEKAHSNPHPFWAKPDVLETFQ